jgi:hypothetical protein
VPSERAYRCRWGGGCGAEREAAIARGWARATCERPETRQAVASAQPRKTPRTALREPCCAPAAKTAAGGVASAWSARLERVAKLSAKRPRERHMPAARTIWPVLAGSHYVASSASVRLMRARSGGCGEPADAHDVRALAAGSTASRRSADMFHAAGHAIPANIYVLRMSFIGYDGTQRVRSGFTRATASRRERGRTVGLLHGLLARQAQRSQVGVDVPAM